MTTYYNYLGQAMPVSASPTSYVKDDGGPNGSAQGHVTLTANPGPSAVDTNGGNYDTLIGGQGDVTFYVSNITDVVQVGSGLSGVKSIVSWAGGYTLPDNVQNLTFYGAGNWGAGNSLNNLIIMGGNDQNTMDGGGGNDVLVGGLGENDFQFEVASSANHDVFYNFHPSTDTVRISGANFTSFAQIQQAMTQTTGPDGQTDVVLTLDGNNSITFRDTTVAQMQPRDFLLPLDTSQLGALTFSDNFTGLNLFDAATGQGNWQTNFGGDLTSANAYFIQGNDEKQLYTAPNFKGENGYDLSAYNPFSINNGGGLTIKAGQFSYADSQHTWGQAYYSGMLNTRGVFMQKYGYFDMKAELPTTLGTWPGFWLSQDPYKPGVEGDVLEHLAMYPDVNFARTDDAGTVTGHTTYIPALSGFHDYGMMWTPTTTTFYIDNLAVLQVATPASWDQPMYMLLNMALGGWGGPIDAGGLPAQMQVQYVHVYGLADAPVDVSEGYASYTVPTGVNGVTLIGANQTVTANNAGDILTSNDGGNHLIGGTWNDTIVLGGGGDVATGADGADAFVVNAVPATASTITDFSASDQLNLSGLLSNLGYAGSNPIGDGMIRFSDDGHGDAQVWAMSNSAWALVTTLEGVSAGALAMNGGVIAEGSGGGTTSGGGTAGGTGGGTGGGVTVTATWSPGDFNGDHISDLVFAQTSGVDWGYAGMNGANSYNWHDAGNSGGLVAVAKGDMTGDGVPDVVFRNNATGEWGFAAMNPGGNGYNWHAAGNSGVPYAIGGMGDFNGDGISDVVFRDNATGDWGYAQMHSGGGAYTWVHEGNSGANYSIEGTGDFNGDGIADVAFRDNTTGDWGYAAMGPSGFAWHHIGNSGAGYTVEGAGDFNGDGVSDIVFRNDATGDWGYAAMNPNGFTWAHVGVNNPGYSIVSTGDFNGDGHMDVAMLNSTTGDWGYLALTNQGATWHDVGALTSGYFIV